MSPTEKSYYATPKCVLISDIHYNINNLTLADACLKKAVSKAEELGVPLIVAGDMHDTKAIVRGECIKAIMNTLRIGPVRRIVMPGNHCMLNEKSKEHSLEFLRNLCDIIDTPTLDEETGFWFIPYQHDPEEVRKIVSSIPKGSTIIAHQGVSGAKEGHYIHDRSAVLKEIFADYRVISGHYHRAQDIKCGRPRKNGVGLFSYIGSPYTTSFAEANDGPKGFRILYDNGLLELVPTNLRKHVVLERCIDNVNTPVDINPGDLIWLKVSGPHSELEKLKKQDLGMNLFGHTNFKLDKIYTDAPKLESKKDKLTGPQLMDTIIDATDEKFEEKSYLKSLWREVL